MLVQKRLYTSAEPEASAHRAPPPIANPPGEMATSRWVDLPHDLLVRIFAEQPEALHNVGAEFTCRAWGCAVRECHPSHHDQRSISCSVSLRPAAARLQAGHHAG